MARFAILEPAGIQASPDMKIVRDSFSYIAFVLPLFWLLWNRLWIHALVFFVIAGVIPAVLGGLGAAPFVTLISLPIGLLVALEGRLWCINRLEKKGYQLSAIIDANSEHDAEIRYYNHLFGQEAQAPSVPLDNRLTLSAEPIGDWPQ